MSVRVRFAPSPTGALHIGGIRTALYNYLLARQKGGQFILRIEDTDRNRYVPGAETYIIEALKWCGIEPDESPVTGGPYGPYRQSERLKLYQEHAQKLLNSGWAYYAFDTAEQLDARREAAHAEGGAFMYSAATRMQLENSLTLPPDEVNDRLKRNEPYVIRFKMPANEEIIAYDMVRDEVRFRTAELDDKVLMKSDGWPTYHLANVVDDHLMRITHVIRGEEWLPSVGLHVMLYKAFGWADTMPAFGHLPLILRPDGKGKLSKRDGAKFGFPVFPLSWIGQSADDSFVGFREFGFEPEAVVNFLALLGWNPGTEQEIFTLDELVAAFDMAKVNKAGARFDFDKALWYNRQHLSKCDDAVLADRVRQLLKDKGHEPSTEQLDLFITMLKERVTFLYEFWEKGAFLFEDIHEYDEAAVKQKWKPGRAHQLLELAHIWTKLPTWAPFDLEAATKSWMAENGLKAGEVYPSLRLALCGSLQGPAFFDALAFLGPEVARQRIQQAVVIFERLARAEI